MGIHDKHSRLYQLALLKVHNKHITRPASMQIIGMSQLITSEIYNTHIRNFPHRIWKSAGVSVEVGKVSVVANMKVCV